MFSRAHGSMHGEGQSAGGGCAAANAIAGDERGPSACARPRKKSPRWRFVRGLAALKIPICPLIKDYLNKGNSAEARERFLWATRRRADGECLSFAITTAKNRTAGRVERTLALASSWPQQQRPMPWPRSKDVLKIPIPNVQAAAILAEHARARARALSSSDAAPS